MKIKEGSIQSFLTVSRHNILQSKIRQCTGGNILIKINKDVTDSKRKKERKRKTEKYPILEYQTIVLKVHILNKMYRIKDDNTFCVYCYNSQDVT